MDIHQLQSALEALIRDDPQWRDARLGPLHFVASGWESEIYAFRLDGLATPQPIRMVLRLYPGDRAQEVARREYDALLRLHAADYPVPQPYRLALDSPYFEQPLLVMDYIPGEQMWALLGNSSPEQAERLLEILARRLVELHRLNWRRFSDLLTDQRPRDAYYWIDRWLGEVQAVAEQLDLQPFQPVLDWLHERREQAACQQPAAVHWDYHPGNLIIQPDGSAVVLDWTQFSVSDPRFDLAWCLLLLRIYEDDARSQRMLDLYRQAWDAPLDKLEYFEAAMAFKRLGSIYISLSQSPERLGMRAGASQVMRQQGREAWVVYDFLRARTGLRLPELEAFLQHAFDKDGR